MTDGDGSSPMSLEQSALRSLSDLAPCFRSLYPSFRYFNVVQSDSFDVAYHSDANMVVAAPTGTGKTVVMELSMLRLFSRNIDGNGIYQPKPGQMKVIYIAPTRSLVQERVRDWSERFGAVLNAKVSELTGDVEEIRSKEIDKSDIICATPEKFGGRILPLGALCDIISCYSDAVSRKHQDYGGTRFFGDISLMLIDEVHLLNEIRGSVLEAGVVSRVQVVSKLESMKHLCIASARFVAVSATIPNAPDLATWLNVPPEGLLVYGEEVRPVKIHTIVKGYRETKNDYLFERSLNDFLYPVIAEHSKARPSLVFCSTRKGTSDTAQHLIKQSAQHFPNTIGSPFVRDTFHMQRLADASKKASSKPLQQCLVRGIAFHHAGMDASDRSLVENAFLNQDILVLCTTGTLAMGVNLPAHLVVIKGTRYYCGSQESGIEQNGYKEYERGMCLQMIGRAGRPQFDTEGVAVIMTQRQNIQRYENLAMGCEELESQLKTCFAEYLNAEIVLGTIKNMPLAVEWLKSTFMYIRAMQNPLLYGIPIGISSQQEFDKIMTERFLLDNLQTLQQHEMVEKETGKGGGFASLECGRLMAYYYVRLNTMIRIGEAPSHASIPDLIHIISRAEELDTVRLRRGEKKTLNDINCRRSNAFVKFQLLDGGTSGKPRQRISTGQEKIFILLNDALSETPLESIDVSLRQETTQILKVAETISRCMTRYYASTGCFAAAANAKILLKSIKARLWEDSSVQCKQLSNIGKLLGDRLAKGGIGKLRQLAKADPRQIESLTMKNYPFGNTLLQDLQKRMPPEIDLKIRPLGVTGDGTVKVQLFLERKKEADLCQAQFMGSAFVCGTTHDDKLLFHQAINLKTFQSPYTVYVYAQRGTKSQKPVQIVASVIMDKLVGMDTVTKFVVPFDLKSVHWMPDDVQHIPEKKNDTGQCPPTEDEMNNSDAIQRLSAVEETKSPPPSKQRKESPFSEKKPSDLVPLSKLSQQSRKLLPLSSGIPVEMKPREGQADGCANKMKVESQEHRSAVQTFDMDTHKQICSQEHNNKIPVREGFGDTRGRNGGYLMTKATKRASASTQQRVGSNRSSSTTLAARASNTDSRWRECLTKVEASGQTKKQNTLPVNDTLRHLRERHQRPHMDWSTRAKAILASRNQQRSLDLPNAEPNEMCVWKEEIREFSSKQTAQQTKRQRMDVDDRQSAKKSARRTQQPDNDHILAQDNDASSSDLSNEINNMNPLISSGDDIRSAKNRTESDVDSLFSFL